MQDFALVDRGEDGSPCGEKLFLLWNPPLKMHPGVAKKAEAKTGGSSEGSGPATASDSDRCGGRGAQLQRGELSLCQTCGACP